MKNKKELMIMKEKTIFPREEKSEVLFDKILNDPWAYNKLFQTFCNNLFCNDDSEHYSTAILIKTYLHFLWLSRKIPCLIY